MPLFANAMNMEGMEEDKIRSYRRGLGLMNILTSFFLLIGGLVLVGGGTGVNFSGALAFGIVASCVAY